MRYSNEISTNQDNGGALSIQYNQYTDSSRYIAMGKERCQRRNKNASELRIIDDNNTYKVDKALKAQRNKDRRLAAILKYQSI